MEPYICSNTCLIFSHTVSLPSMVLLDNRGCLFSCWDVESPQELGVGSLLLFFDILGVSLPAGCLALDSSSLFLSTDTSVVPPVVVLGSEVLRVSCVLETTSCWVVPISPLQLLFFFLGDSSSVFTFLLVPLAVTASTATSVVDFVDRALPQLLLLLLGDSLSPLHLLFVPLAVADFTAPSVASLMTLCLFVGVSVVLQDFIFCPVTLQSSSMQPLALELLSTNEINPKNIDLLIFEGLTKHNPF